MGSNESHFNQFAVLESGAGNRPGRRGRHGARLSAQSRELVSILLRTSVALGGFAALAMLGACSDAHSETAAAMPPPPVQVSEAVQREVADWDTFTGRFEAVEHVDLRPRVSGYIEAVSFTEGAVVKKGDVLFRIDARPYRATLDQARAQLARAEAQYQLAGSELERAENLLRAKAISREEYDQRVSDRSQLEANLKAARAAVEAAALDVEFTAVLAPISGRVSRAEVTAGNYVNAGQTLLTTLVSVSPIYVYFDGDEQTYLKYSSADSPEDKPVRIGLAGEQGFPHEGQMDFLDNAIDPASGTIRARAVLDNTNGRFTPGLFARVQVMGSRQASVTLIDERAIGTDQDRRFVYVVDGNDTVQYRAIQPGESNEGLRIVKAGLKPGERVVLGSLAMLRPGMPVSPRPVVENDQLALK